MKLNLQFKINEAIYLRDPQETKLGKKIISNSIELISEMGFESFTFKKLSQKIGSTEASVYRYFENKHKLLLFLMAWYWEWIYFNIDFANSKKNHPLEKLETVLRILSHSSVNDVETDIDENLLYTIVLNEGSKSFHTIDVDEENQQGTFLNFKKISIKIADIIREINSDYLYPNSLSTLLIDCSLNHIYYSDHLPTLVNIHKINKEKEILEFLIRTVKSILKVEFKK